MSCWHGNSSLLDSHIPKHTPTHSHAHILTVGRVSLQQLAEEIQAVHFAQWGKQTLFSNRITLHNTPLIAQQYANKMLIGANRWFLFSLAMEPLMAARGACERRGCRSGGNPVRLCTWRMHTAATCGEALPVPTHDPAVCIQRRSTFTTGSNITHSCMKTAGFTRGLSKFDVVVDIRLGSVVERHSAKSSLSVLFKQSLSECRMFKCSRGLAIYSAKVITNFKTIILSC